MQPITVNYAYMQPVRRRGAQVAYATDHQIAKNGKKCGDFRVFLGSPA